MAKGLGGLLGVGREQKRQALAGLTRAAQLETQTDTINRQLKAQKRAAEMNVLGTAGGIAGAQALTGSGSAMASIGAAAPYVLLAIAGGYLLKKIFD